MTWQSRLHLPFPVLDLSIFILLVSRLHVTNSVARCTSKFYIFSCPKCIFLFHASVLHLPIPTFYFHFRNYFFLLPKFRFTISQISKCILNLPPSNYQSSMDDFWMTFGRTFGKLLEDFWTAWKWCWMNSGRLLEDFWRIFGRLENYVGRLLDDSYVAAAVWSTPPSYVAVAVWSSPPMIIFLFCSR